MSPSNICTSQGNTVRIYHDHNILCTLPNLKVALLSSCNQEKKPYSELKYNVVKNQTPEL